jgi:hypothetical protein
MGKLTDALHKEEDRLDQSPYVLVTVMYVHHCSASRSPVAVIVASRPDLRELGELADLTERAVDQE